MELTEDQQLEAWRATNERLDNLQLDKIDRSVDRAWRWFTISVIGFVCLVPIAILAVLAIVIVSVVRG